MRTRKLGKSGLEVSAIGLGCSAALSVSERQTASGDCANLSSRRIVFVTARRLSRGVA
jgi:aryl-alcohol dehydrogenase-like predicted oxidoreductase